MLTQSSLWANAVRQGYGSDYLSIDAHQRQEFLKYWWLGNVFFPITSYLYKSSVLLLNQRIFVQKPFQITCWCIFAANTCWFLGNWFALVFQCLPIPSMWGAAVATKCIEFNDLWISLVSWSVSMDVIILSLPLPMIWKLHLKIAGKLNSNSSAWHETNHTAKACTDCIFRIHRQTHADGTVHAGRDVGF